MEKGILRVLTTRKGFNKLQAYIEPDLLSKHVKVVVKALTRYYKEFKDTDKVDLQVFFELLQKWEKMETQSVVDYYAQLVANMGSTTETDHAVIINYLVEERLAVKLAEALETYGAGDEIDLISATGDMHMKAMADIEVPEYDQWIQPELEDLIAEDTTESGLNWRLDCINQAWSPLQPGDSVIIAGRPGKGKTTFLTDQLSYMAKQIDDRPILWCNNEGDGKRIVKRLMQSALNATMSELVTKNSAGTLKQEYADAVGDYNRIRVVDIHGYYNYQVEKLIEFHKPKLVVLDMVDNIKFAGLSLDGGARTDQILEEMYKWARIMGVKYNCTILPTSQISNEGAGIPFPAEGMLKDSKTGKQGACDAILMIGHSDDPTLERSRFLGDPKGFKNAREGAATLRAEVFFDKDRGRYTEVTVK